jgi:hypothetical protein
VLRGNGSLVGKNKLRISCDSSVCRLRVYWISSSCYNFATKILKEGVANGIEKNRSKFFAYVEFDDMVAATAVTQNLTILNGPIMVGHGATVTNGIWTTSRHCTVNIRVLLRGNGSLGGKNKLWTICVSSVCRLRVYYEVAKNKCKSFNRDSNPGPPHSYLTHEPHY